MPGIKSEAMCMVVLHGRAAAVVYHDVTIDKRVACTRCSLSILIVVLRNSVKFHRVGQQN